MIILVGNGIGDPNSNPRRVFALMLFQNAYIHPVQSAWPVEYTDCLYAEGNEAPTPINECPRYNTKKSNGKVQVILEFWGLQSTLSMPSFPVTLWLGVIAPDRVLFMDQRKLFDV